MFFYLKSGIICERKGYYMSEKMQQSLKEAIREKSKLVVLLKDLSESVPAEEIVQSLIIALEASIKDEQSPSTR